jgi:hypothetical protein
VSKGRLGFVARMGVIGAIFGAVITPVIATLISVAATGGGFSLKGLGAFLLVVAVIATPIGAMCGMVEGVWLGIVGPNCKSRLRLTVHGAAAGFALSVLFLLVDWSLHRPQVLETSLDTAFPVVVGTCVGAAGAAVFARTLMRQSRTRAQRAD